MTPPSALKTEALLSCNASVCLYQTAWRHFPEDDNRDGRMMNLSALKIRCIEVGLYFKHFQQSCYCT
jgi:hypothetical protein